MWHKTKSKEASIWTTADECRFIDALAAKGVSSVERYIAAIGRRVWPKSVNATEVRKHALRCLKEAEREQRRRPLW